MSRRCCRRYRRARGRSRSIGSLSMVNKPRVTMNSHKNTLSNIFCKIRPRTWSARSCMCRCVCACISVFICLCSCMRFFTHMRVRSMYMPIMAVKTRNVHCIKNPCALGATCSFYLCSIPLVIGVWKPIFFLFNITARNCCKRLKSIFRQFLFFSFFVLSPSPFRHVYKISITIKS